MSVRFLDHTADMGAEITAGSRDELFAEAALSSTSEAGSAVEGV